MADGTQHTDHRILTLDISVDVLLDNFEVLTGQSPVFRNASEWTVIERPGFSPERDKLAGYAPAGFDFVVTTDTIALPSRSKAIAGP